MLELALREGRGPVTIAEIASAQRIPVRFLEAIMRQLKQAGLAESARGKEGGYYLTRPAGSIHAGEIVALFTGPLFANPDQRGPNRSADEEPDVFASLWREADSAVASVFERHTLASLVEQELQRRYTTASNYTI